MASASPVPQRVTPPDSPPARAIEPRIRSHPSLVTPPLLSYYNTLYTALGPQHWWPARTRFEIIVGAILTQNTSWKNVRRAISNLRQAKLLSPAAIHAASPAILAQYLRPAGYFRQKTRTLKSFVDFFYAVYGGSFLRLFAVPTPELREQLLALRGVGPETADCILLYAGRRSVFVVDAYSRRILERHGIIPPRPASARRDHSRKSYESLRRLFESQLPSEPQLFNEFHALIVHTGKHFCRKSEPDCPSCPLAEFLPMKGSSPVTSQPRVTRGQESRVTMP